MVEFTNLACCFDCGVKELLLSLGGEPRLSSQLMRWAPHYVELWYISTGRPDRPSRRPPGSAHNLVSWFSGKPPLCPKKYAQVSGIHCRPHTASSALIGSALGFTLLTCYACSVSSKIKHYYSRYVLLV